MKLLERLGAWLCGVAAEPTAAPVDADTYDAPPEWFPLPGGQIELADTGFRIVLDLSAEGRQATVYNPEGRAIACGYDWQVEQLKEHAESVAEQRAQFSAPALIWSPPK